jgi:hypothetical protein
MSAPEPALAVVPRSPAEIDAPVTNGEIDQLFRLADGLSRSGFFPDARQATQAFAKLVFGRDLGLSATQAMTGIDIIEGKPEVNANVQASKVRASDRYEYRIVELTDERCEIVFSLDGDELHPSSVFTMEDAKKAKLDGKNNWKQYPRNMLFARAMSNGVAFHCPDVMNGIRVYAQGEISESEMRSTERPAPENTATAEGEPEDATTVDPPLSDEAKAELISAFKEAGATIDMFLTAVGLDCTDDITEQSAIQLTGKLAEHLARQNGGES